MIKRSIDFLLSILLLIFLVPMMPLVYLLWRVFVGDSMLFKQKRVGLDGKIFTIYKLRSMVKNAEMLRGRDLDQYQQLNSAPAPMFKIGDDPRFIKIKLGNTNKYQKELNLGKLLSHTGLDELPQLWNILLGDMAFFGPRPLPVTEAEQLKGLAPGWHAWRHQVRPGIFSLWSLDKRRHQSLKIWQKLEKDSLKMSLSQQYLTIGKILCQQCQKILFFWKI